MGNAEKYLKSSDLVFGHIYLFENGRVGLYLGKTVNKEFCFYDFMPVLFIYTGGDGDSKYKFHIKNQELVVNCENSFITTSFNTFPNSEAFNLVKSMPKVYCEYPFYNVSINVTNWLLDAASRGVKIPQLLALIITPKSRAKGMKTYEDYESGEVCGVGDMIPGALYYTGNDPWRSTILYLGRQTCGKFAFVYVGDTNNIVRLPVLEYLRQWYATPILVRKNLGRLRPLWSYSGSLNVGESPFARRVDFRANMNGITQDILDGFVQSSRE